MQSPLQRRCRSSSSCSSQTRASQPHRRRAASVTTTCLLQQLFQKPNRKAKAELLRAVEDCRFGADHSAEERELVIQLASQLTSRTARAPAGVLDGKWRLLWTTEASMLSIIRGPLPVVDISQEFDLSGGRVTNEITFAALGFTFAASGPLQVTSPIRVAYALYTLTLAIGGLRVSLPSPFGREGGWTEASYVDSEMRVMQNSRGDTLVLERM